jgi:hypothetical protein
LNALLLASIKIRTAEITIAKILLKSWVKYAKSKTSTANGVIRRSLFKFRSLRKNTIIPTKNSQILDRISKKLLSIEKLIVNKTPKAIIKITDFK